MKYILITVRNILKVEILTEIFQTKNDAYKAMKTALYNRVKMDEKNVDQYMEMLEDGIEFSNMILKENSAYIYQDFGKTYHYWKIIEV